MEDPDEIGPLLAARLRALRAERGLTLEELATRAGVGRSTISLIERAEASPTAAVLNRLATGLGVTLASLFEPAEAAPSPLARRADQPAWRDPLTGYLRRALSPPGSAGRLELVEVELEAGARVALDGGLGSVVQQVWLIEGSLEVRSGADRHRLEAGDCLAMRIDRPTGFANPGTARARYLVAIAPGPAAGPRPEPKR
jgi:transcriptional regulator with XRE-family HTH domain